jgi:selenocysteine-specific elongation factor
VIEPLARKRRRSDVAAAAALAALERGSASERIAAVLAGRPALGLTAEEIAARTGTPRAEVESALAELLAGGAAGELGRGRYASGAYRDEIAAEIEVAAREYQGRFPLRHGMPRGELRSRFAGRLKPEAVDAMVEELVVRGVLHPREDRLRCGEPELRLPPRLRVVADRLREVLIGAGYAVPSMKDALARAGAPAGTEGQELLGYLAASGEVVRLADDLVYAPEQLARLESAVTAVLQAKGELAVADFKEITGVSRKYAVPLLEYLDGRGITRRSGDNRVPGRLLAGRAAGDGAV